MRFYHRVGYHDYEGLTDSFDERERIVAALGKNRALVMRHHGVTTVGVTAREAFSLMKEFVRAARIQLMMESSGQPVLEIAPEICEHVAAQYEHHDRGRASAEWPAYLRLLDGIDPRLPRLTPRPARRRRRHWAAMNPLWILRTARLVLTPVGGADLPDLRAIKADPRVFAIMLGGVRTPAADAQRNWPTMSSPGAPTASASGRSAAAPQAGASSSASPDWSSGRTAAASRCASRYGRRRKAAASRARPPAPRCASVTTRLACHASSRWHGRTISPRAWCWAASA